MYTKTKFTTVMSTLVLTVGASVQEMFNSDDEGIVLFASESSYEIEFPMKHQWTVEASLMNIPTKS